MKTTFACFLLACISIFSISFIQAQSPKKTAKSITPESIINHISVLANDSMLGRKTPGPELEKSAQYIAAQFKNFGLEPVNGSYFQPVYLSKCRLGNNNSVIITRGNTKYNLEIKKDFIPFESSANISVDAQLVFAGYGITAPEYNYDDYANIDVQGKIVLILDHEPGEEDIMSVFDGAMLSEYGKHATKLKNAIEHGAGGLILITDPLNHLLIKPIGSPWPSLSKIIPDDAIPTKLVKNNKDNSIPFVHMGKKMISLVFEDIDSLKNIQKAIDESLVPNSFSIPGIKINIRTNIEKNITEVKNVVGFLKGSSAELSDEVVVIGAHYDHIGYKKKVQPGVDSIFNGADDNASGTSGMLNVAEAFSKMNIMPKRSILFIAFTGEEIGLFGSQYYTANPLFPIEKTVVMLNLDMIGRNARDTLQLHEAKEQQEIVSIIQEQNKILKTKLKLVEQGHSGGSDHAPFIEAGVPSIFFFTGLHKDYHAVSDQVELIDSIKAANVARLCFGTAWHIANDNSYYKSK
ncbi:MAG: M20/M25/M40 family metallo-hydrolase [Bacteroidales bacterium]|nr:M20/M25/M40 family metallo-hydrolase [Bacteroidales bacterium]MBN2817888.1 M20/M25/M40 family metallo-hydrolase [Bacteroidales bacterium]